MGDKKCGRYSHTQADDLTYFPICKKCPNNRKWYEKRRPRRSSKHVRHAKHVKAAMDALGTNTPKLRSVLNAHYIHARGGQSECPEGYTRVTSEKECFGAAAKALAGGHTGDNACHHISTPGCFSSHKQALYMAKSSKKCLAVKDTSADHYPVCKRNRLLNIFQSASGRLGALGEKYDD